MAIELRLQKTQPDKKMKLRIKGNSIRLRLSKMEVSQLCQQGLVEERTNIGSTVFTYSLQKTNGENIEASFAGTTLAIAIPSRLIEKWETNTTVGFDNRLADGTMPSLYILIEKDFKCIDNSDEDQSNNYENPKNC